MTPLVARMTEFVLGIGLPCRTGDVPERTFMPGVTVDHGSIVFDPAKLTYPGDLLHEAGHLAVMSPERRRSAHWTAGQQAADEMMAIAWSYAAAVHLQIDPAIVFHDGGYRGGSRALLENFAEGRYIGVPMLQWLGMTVDGRTAARTGVAPYPAMAKWINERSVSRADAPGTRSA